MTNPNYKMWYDADGWRWYDDKPSLTTILSNTVANPKLAAWFKKNSEKAIEKRVTETADLGTRAHACFEAILKNEPFEIEPDTRLLVESFTTWKNENNVKPLYVEKSIGSDVYGYACTLDFIGYVNGELTLIDWKTSKSYKITNGWQMGAQRICALEKLDLPPGKELGMMGVQVARDTGLLKTFKYEHIESVENAFLNTLDVFKMLYFNKLSKLNYPWLFQKAMVRNKELTPIYSAKEELK